MISYGSTAADSSGGGGEHRSKDAALEAFEPRLDERRDGDADQHAGEVREKVEEIRVAVDEWDHLAELAHDSKG